MNEGSSLTLSTRAHAESLGCPRSDRHQRHRRRRPRHGRPGVRRRANHHLEVYLATQGGYDRDHNLAFTAPHVEVNYGAAPDLQLHLIAPLQYARPAGGPAVCGYGDMELGANGSS
jgi:hypothetical protein